MESKISKVPGSLIFIVPAQHIGDVTANITADVYIITSVKKVSGYFYAKGISVSTGRMFGPIRLFTAPTWSPA